MYLLPEPPTYFWPWPNSQEIQYGGSSHLQLLRPLPSVRNLATTMSWGSTSWVSLYCIRSPTILGSVLRPLSFKRLPYVTIILVVTEASAVAPIRSATITAAACQRGHRDVVPGPGSPTDLLWAPGSL